MGQIANQMLIEVIFSQNSICSYEYSNTVDFFLECTKINQQSRHLLKLPYHV